MEARLIEELSLNAWPALQTRLYDGWVLRFANGYTKRANSVTPLYEGLRPISENISHCRNQFARQNLPLIFRLPSFVEMSAEIDNMLVQHGFEQIDITSVQTTTVGSVGVDARAVRMDSAEWLTHFHNLNHARQDSTTHLRMLNAIVSPACYMGLQVDNEIVACGLAVAEGGYVGLFDIVSAEAQRRRGYGKAIVQSLMAWGKTQDAETAYLQVMTENAPAVALYRKLGFFELYQYWYRIEGKER